MLRETWHADSFDQISRATSQKRITDIVLCMLYKNLDGQPAIGHGRISEAKSIDTFQRRMNFLVQKYGKIIDEINRMISAVCWK